MSQLSDLYNERKKEYDAYVIEKTKYQTRVETYVNKITSAEKALAKEFESLPDDIKEVIRPMLPDFEEKCSPENARERINKWREVYKSLESKGLDLLGGAKQ